MRSTLLTLAFVLLWPLSVSRAELRSVSVPKYEVLVTRKLDWQWVYIGKVKITAYCANCSVCDTGWRTADMTYADYRKGIVAADKAVPFGLQVMIEGLSEPLTVRDRGKKVKGNHLDVLMESHRAARRWGVQYKDVWVWQQVEMETRENVPILETARN